MGRLSLKYKQYAAPLAAQSKPKQSRYASVFFGTCVMVWSLYSLHLYAGEMASVLNQLSSSQNGSTQEDSSAPHREGTHWPPGLLRLSQIQETRVTRQVANQEDYQHVNKCPAHLPADQVQTTLVTLLDTRRLWAAKEICSRWSSNPIIMMVYFANNHDETYGDIATSFQQEMGSACPHAQVIFVMNDIVQEEEDHLYPVNLLRNLALELVQTSHVLFVDPDFVPSNKLDEEIQRALQVHHQAQQLQNITTTDDRGVLVVPAFEANFYSNEQELFLENPSQNGHLIPSDFEGLTRCLITNTCKVAKEKSTKEAHSSTRTKVWLGEHWYQEVSTMSDGAPATTMDIKKVPCTDSSRYEPYMVVPWCPSNQASPEPISPLYDERFLGFGHNQIQYVEHIRHCAFDFYLVPNGFLVHTPHAFPDEVKTDHSELWGQFQNEIHQKYFQNIRFRKCTQQHINEMKQEEDEAAASPPKNTPTQPAVISETPEVKVAVDDQGIQFFNTSSLKTNVLRLSSLRQARTTREVANQEDYKHINSCPANLVKDQMQTTLVTQLGTNRLWLAKEICSRWKGPLVIVVYFSDETTFSNIAASFREDVEKNCTHMDLLFVVNDSKEEDLYPINLLRNLALEATRTSHVLLHDADFLPSEDLAKQVNGALRLHTEARQTTSTSGNDALVVPAFQIEFQEESRQKDFLNNPADMAHLIPRKFPELKDCVNTTTCSVFHEKHCPDGHRSTRQHIWLQEQWYREIHGGGEATIKDIKPVPCMDSRYYEPYLVLPWCPFQQDAPQRIAPLYDERFTGYGMNKVAYIENIRHLAYEFFIVPTGFLIHAPHAFSSERIAWDQDSDALRTDNKALYRDFVDEIHQKYGHNIKFRKCKEEDRLEFEKEDQANGENNSTDIVSTLETENKLTSEPDTATSRIEIQLFDSPLLKTTFRMTDLQLTRTPRTFWNEENYRNATSCPANLRKKDIRTTLVTQMSSHRIWLAKEICSRWKDPIVMLVYFPDSEIYSSAAPSFLEEMESECTQAKLLFVVNDSTEATLYPINLLRNLALEGVRTSHVLLHDADFLPSKELASEIDSALKIRAAARERLGIRADEKDAMVVPAFQYEFQNKDQNEKFLHNPSEMANWIPRTFDALHECINSTSCMVFHEKHYPKGHSSTRTHSWLEKNWYDEVDGTSDAPLRDLKHVFCLDSDFYEPYVVLPWCALEKVAPERVSPLYDERFVGYGMNKNQFFEHIRHLRYDFIIVPRGFLIHAPHEESRERVAWDRNTEYLRRTNKDIFMEFTKDAHKRYGQSNVKLIRCEFVEKEEKEKEEKKNLLRARQ